jgi:putative alpha-1,2-mannosidase
VFVKKITVNGSRLAHSFVTYKKIAKAGKMIFELAAEH